MGRVTIPLTQETIIIPEIAAPMTMETTILGVVHRILDRAGITAAAALLTTVRITRAEVALVVVTMEALDRTLDQVARAQTILGQVQIRVQGPTVPDQTQVLVLTIPARAQVLVARVDRDLIPEAPEGPEVQAPALVDLTQVREDRGPVQGAPGQDRLEAVATKIWSLVHAVSREGSITLKFAPHVGPHRLSPAIR